MQKKGVGLQLLEWKVYLQQKSRIDLWRLTQQDKHSRPSLFIPAMSKFSHLIRLSYLHK